ncbi:MAG: mRNA interferase MazF [Candidatus Eremiobacteraeota bacterium]|jgi:uncharacterized protein YifN (PemK superfamily)|nr:mRNA interferase MazF [Candidatus Eremiobacteraeota bacterium]
MALLFSPAPGEVLWCNFEAPFSTQFHPPEMTKKRRVVVLSPRNRSRVQDTIVVVPLSTQPPAICEPYHYQLVAQYPFLHNTKKIWVKGNMVRHVSVKRLSPFYRANIATARCLTAQDLVGARRAAAASIGVSLVRR